MMSNSPNALKFSLRVTKSHSSDVPQKDLPQREVGEADPARAVDVGVATAVAQQDLALAVCVISEAVVTRERVAEGTPGRPDLGFVGRGCGALVGAFALIQSDNELATPTGLVLAAAATLGLAVGPRKDMIQVLRAAVSAVPVGKFSRTAAPSACRNEGAAS